MLSYCGLHTTQAWAFPIVPVVPVPLTMTEAGEVRSGSNTGRAGLGGGWGNRLGGRQKASAPLPITAPQEAYGRCGTAGKMHVNLLCMGEETGALWLI